TYLYPVYLAQIRGYNALMIGETMFLTGLCMFLTAPLVGRLIGKVDPRLLMAIGFFSFGVGTWWASFITHDWGFQELIWPQVFRGFGLMMAMIPVNNLSLGTLPPERVKNASGLFNLTRNLGGAVGLAVLTTILNDRTDLHIARLHEAVTWSREPAVEALRSMTERFHDFGSDAQAMALKQLTNLVHRESVVMAFADVFLFLTALSFALCVLAIFLRKPPAGAGGGGGGH
ncbi:MAG TPA: MFS transporter, partial [Hyphomicrobiales bacterium]